MQTEGVAIVERLLLEKFRTEPFHNLYMRLGRTPSNGALGGTCSDKALSFWRSVTALGFPASLHTARIGGVESHRLVKVWVDGDSYLADVGNGWPSVKLFPLDREVHYSRFGISHRSEFGGRGMRIYNTRDGVERLQMDTSLDSASEATILEGIRRRFEPGRSYPFSDRIRFSQVVGEQFLFLRDDVLEIYEESGSSRVPVERGFDALARLLRVRFDFDLRGFAEGRRL
ncbi:MAG: arylamine N-acetyltransferase [Proteobacteria bacterium]|nr:arylamine N-acetyltransferase [Pseudomonadota bacterium]